MAKSTNEGVYIKLREYLIILEGVVPKYFCEGLKFKETEHRRNPQLAYQSVKEELQYELKIKTKDLFDQFKEQPNYIGIFGQVHKTVLEQNFAEVAVKVQYPYMKDQVESDIKFLRWIADYCDKRYNHQQQQKINISLCYKYHK